MENINKKGVLNKAFSTLTKGQVQVYLQKKIGFILDKNKSKIKKEDYRPAFLGLSEVMNSNDLEDLMEMAVMKKKRGLASYTFKLRDDSFYKGKTTEELKAEYQQLFPVDSLYQIAVNIVDNTEKILEMNIKVKEYEGSWRTQVQDLTTLSSVSNHTVTIEKLNNKLSIEVGDDEIAEVIETFLSRRFKMKIEPYTIKVVSTSLTSDSASPKTMLLIDFIYNRLKSKNISSKFDDINFKINESRARDGVEAVKIFGSDIIYSDLACEYITLANDIIDFKSNMIYQGKKFTGTFSLRGEQKDRLKIVISGNTNDDFKNIVMEIIQNEYIEMCVKGFKDIKATRDILQPIYSSYINSRE
ncbi:hypothetical protein COJ92_16025 [Priestia megaterium]|uniref:hypothetical protein n=1 Tax=Priestia megaterium TaxID=1404 RepID=UPI000BFA9522|nr:hypothetical protein [Priestia megaterium]PFP17751.1 hypothetical protein COJ92_16025 [Priestia megaterium]